MVTKAPSCVRVNGAETPPAILRVKLLEAGEEPIIPVSQNN